MTDSKPPTIESLVYQLNAIARQRKELLDRLWALENETEKLRLELMALLMEDKG